MRLSSSFLSCDSSRRVMRSCIAVNASSILSFTWLNTSPISRAAASAFSVGVRYDDLVAVARVFARPRHAGSDRRSWAHNLSMCFLECKFNLLLTVIVCISHVLCPLTKYNISHCIKHHGRWRLSYISAIFLHIISHQLEFQQLFILLVKYFSQQHIRRGTKYYLDIFDAGVERALSYEKRTDGVFDNWQTQSCVYYRYSYLSFRINLPSLVLPSCDRFFSCLI